MGGAEAASSRSISPDPDAIGGRVDQWLLARHRGRAALVSTHGDARSCRMAKRLSAVHGHAHLDWVMLLDPVASGVLACWQALAHRVGIPHQGQAPIAIGQVLRSDGLSVQCLQQRSGALLMRVGPQRWQLFPSPQALWALQHRQRSEPRQMITGTWLGHRSAVGFWSMERVPGTSASKLIERLRACGEVAESG